MSIAAQTAPLPRAARTPLNPQQVIGFWAAWFGWALDGMDSVIYALVLSPALTELLPRSGIEATPKTIASTGSILFAVFLVGWGLSFIWGPVADKYGRTRTLAATVMIYAVFTGAAALSQNVWELGLFRFLAGIGIGGEWAMAGTYVAESWPEDRRKMGAGWLQTGYYAGFFIAAALNLTVGATYGWRAMFLCGLAPVVVSLVTLFKVEEPKRWAQAHDPNAPAVRRASPLARIFQAPYRGRTLSMSLLLTVAVIGLWAGSVYVPTASIQLARRAGITASGPVIASLCTGLLSIGTILGCIAAPVLAERLGRRRALAIYFAGMLVTIPLAFGWAFYLPSAQAMPVFLAVLFFLGMAGGNFAMFSLWLPELFGTEIRATAFAFCTSVGRFVGAIVNFALAAAVNGMGTLGTPVALTAIAFGLGLLVIPFATETVGTRLPD